MDERRPSSRSSSSSSGASAAAATSSSSVISVHVRHAVRGVGIGRVLLRKLVRQPDLVGVDVCDREAAERPVRFEHVDRTPVREVGHGQVGDVREGSLVFERGRQQLACRRDESLVLGGAALCLVELRRPDCSRREVGDERRRVPLRLVERARRAVVEDERAGDPVRIAQPRDEHCADPRLVMGAPVRRADPVGCGDVFCHERLFEQDGVALPADRGGRALDVRLGEPFVRGHGPGPVARVLAPERVGIGGERPAGKLEDLGEHRLDVERAQERGRGFEEQAEPLDLIAEEAVVL
jgi:hypothetical protein